MSKWLFSVLDEAAVAAVLIAGLGWLLREWIGARLTASIQLHTDTKLEELKKRLDAAEAQVFAVRQAGIDATLQLSGVVVAERVAAIKQIWNGVIEWKRAMMVSTLVSAMTIDYVRKNGDDPRTRAAIKQMLDNLKYMDLLTAMNALQQYRPFLTERAWAVFAAYHGFYVARVTRAFGLMFDKELALRFWEVDSELTVVRATAPPQMTKDYETNSIGTTLPFLNWIEKELLTELQRSLAGEHSGPEASRQAAKIVAAVDGVLLEARKAQAEAQAS